MFSDDTTYDANLVRWEAPDGSEKSIRLTGSTPRGAHLLPAPSPLGCWFELVKEPGSGWSPDSPSLRVDLSGCPGATPPLGLQGFLATSTDPNADSLSVWPEWIGAPDPLPAGTHLAATFTVTASPPAAVPVPALSRGGLLLLGGALCAASAWARALARRPPWQGTRPPGERHTARGPAAR